MPDTPNYPYLAGCLEGFLDMAAYDLTRIAGLTDDQRKIVDDFFHENLVRIRKAAVEFNKN